MSSSDAGAGHEGTPPLTDPLADALARLKSPKVDDRKGALADLEWLADPRACAGVASALEDRNEDVRARAAYLLETLGGIEELLAALSDGRAEVREAAVLGLACSKEPRALQALAERVHDGSPRVRSQAVWELVRGGTDQGMETALRVALAADEKPLRVRATQALEGFGNLNVPFLLRVLEHPPFLDADRARSIVVNALLRKPHPDAVEPLIRVLESSEGQLRETAAHVLGQTRDPRAVPALRRALEIDDPRLQKEAALGLANLRDQESAGRIRQLLASRNMHVQVGAIQALGRLGDLDSVDAIGDAVADRQPLVRLAAVETLPWLAGADPRVIRHLCAALRDEHPKVRAAAARWAGAPWASGRASCVGRADAPPRGGRAGGARARSEGDLKHPGGLPRLARGRNRRDAQCPGLYRPVDRLRPAPEPGGNRPHGSDLRELRWGVSRAVGGPG